MTLRFVAKHNWAIFTYLTCGSRQNIVLDSFPVGACQKYQFGNGLLDVFTRGTAADWLEVSKSELAARMTRPQLAGSEKAGWELLI